ncbi:hypothetical protein ACRRTK_022370 [Alexandromys fortis]
MDPENFVYCVSSCECWTTSAKQGGICLLTQSGAAFLLKSLGNVMKLVSLKCLHTVLSWLSLKV